MKREWHSDELMEHWTMLPQEHKLLGNKSGPTRLGFAVLLKHFQYEGRFPQHPREVPSGIVTYIAQQLDLEPEAWSHYDWHGRAIKYHRAQIRQELGVREATVADGEALSIWLGTQVLSSTHRLEHVREALYQRCRELRLEPPTPERVERLIRAALHQFETQLGERILHHLSPSTRKQLDHLLIPHASTEDETPTARPPESGQAVLQELRTDPGRASLENLLREMTKLDRVRALDVPLELFDHLGPKVLQAYRQRVAVEAPYELRRHPEALRMTLLAVFGHCRRRELTDTLVDLLLELIHRIGARAERKVEKELLEDLKRVNGKTGMLFRLAEAALENPDGVVKEIVFPVVNEATLRELVKEWKSTGPVYRYHVQTVMRSSYQSHYRRMLPRFLHTLEFRSNNMLHQPLIDALALLKKYLHSQARTYPVDEVIPLDGVVRDLWREVIIETDTQGHPRVNRISYELCVLQALRERLRCKEVWVVGADRYRNPDDDVPTDFVRQRQTYYAALQLPTEAEVFVRQLQQEMRAELAALDRSMPTNPDVSILEKAGGWIKLSPLLSQPEPANLVALKEEIARRWPMTSLLDMLKETDLRVGFTHLFRSPTAWENLDRDTLQYRLLLALYGLGTGAGLKRVGMGHNGVSYRDLLYIRRRFITKDHLRQAIAQVVNGIFAARLPEIWGEGTTACASDSRHFRAWDQNLMTEWHARYGKPGIMIYWHTERKSACIHSQLKTCSSSEVAAMIEGVLHHCTEMEIDRQYVDSHGQSEVAFAFCHLLGFQLLPRLKAIHKQRLYQPDAEQPHAYPNLQPVLRRAINWDCMAQEYDNMVKYATALRLGTAETEAILRRFTRHNLQHPTYKALVELGKARRTIFLCRYLRLLELRREIQEGLNIIENWNSANDFILIGTGSEIAANRREDQEVTMLALHLLQNAMVYINTLMIQRVLSEKAWRGRMMAEDFRGLMPLIYGHISPYGTFVLDMTARLHLEPPVITLPTGDGQGRSKTHRQSERVPQSTSNGTRQLALFNTSL
jgi:TnpA family transposase